MFELPEIEGTTLITDGRITEAFPTSCFLLECESREAWLKARRNFICASESASLLGIGFSTNFQLWEDKTGRKPLVVEDNEQMRKGRENEALSRKQFALDHDVEVLDGTNILVVDGKHLDKNGKPFLAATFDAVGFWSDGEPFDIEFKRSESYRLFADPNNMPNKYRAQVVKQMLVGNLHRACLCARVVNMNPYDTRQRKVYEREYWLDDMDETVRFDQEKLLEVETRFWNENVLGDKMPDRILPTI